MICSPYLCNKILEWALKGPVYVSLHSRNPGPKGAGEVDGGKYTRQSISFGAPSEGVCTNDDDVVFPGMPPEKITHVGVWDAKTGGHLLYGLELPTPVEFMSGDTAKLRPGTIIIEQK